MANTPELRFLHYPGWFVRLETLIAAFPPFYSVTSPDTPFKSFYLMFVTLKLLVLTATLISLELSLEKEMIIPGEPSCLPSLSGTTAAWLCQPQTSSSSSCSSPISLPSNFFHLRAAAPGVMIFFPFCFHGSNLCMFCWCSPLQALVTLGMAPVELVALLSLVLAEREVGCWMKAPAFSQLRVTAGTGDPAAQIIEKQSTRARLFSKQL